MNEAKHEVEPHLYTTVIREMIRHENDVTNHRIMWLLIVQGLIANAVVTAGKESGETASALATVGILVTCSAFVILYKSYQARGYLQFLGNEAKQGTLREQDLPLFGWPSQRPKGWRRKVWPCPWIGKASELMEPFFFLPSLLIVPMELGQLSFKRGMIEDYVGARGLKRLGKKKWRKILSLLVTRLVSALEVDDVVLGGGNAKNLKKLPKGCRPGDNAHAFLGGFRLWAKTGHGIATSK